jgi:hypothetical protein
MTRRAWLVILGWAMCNTALPGCAPSTQNLLHGSGSQEDPGARAAVKQAQIGQYSADEPQRIDPPVRPVSGGSPYAQRAQPGPGGRVPEYLQPPPVLPPLKLALPTLSMAVVQKADTNPPVSPQVICETPRVDHDLVNALRMLLSKQPDKALAYLEHYDRAKQELLLQLLPTLVLLSEKPSEQLNPTEVSAMQDQMQGLLVALRARNDLTIDKICLCDEIKGYGLFTPKRNGYVFQAGDMLLIYIELCNTTCESRNGYFVTDINGIATIRDAQGQECLKWNYSEAELPFLSLLPRYDCWRPYQLYLPRKMPPGKYTLTMVMTDRTRPLRQIAHKSVEFMIVPPGSRQ